MNHFIDFHYRKHIFLCIYSNKFCYNIINKFIEYLLIQQSTQFDLDDEILIKLKEFKPDRQNIVLTLGGSFYPIHKNHIRTIEFAAEEIQKLKPDINIMGLYIIPTQVECLSKKLDIRQKELKELDVHRLKMCQLMVEENTQIMVYSYLIKSSRNKGLSQATIRLQDSLNKYFNLCSKQKQDQIQAITITGMDKFELLVRKSKNGMLVFVENRPTFNQEVNVEAIISQNKLEKYRSNIIIIQDEENKQEISSTLIRQKCNKGEDFSEIVTQKLYQYHLDNKIQYPIPKPLEQKEFDENFLKSIPTIDEIVNFDFSKINFEDIKDMDMSKVLGSGVQAKVVQGIYKDQKVAVKIYSLEQEKSSRIRCFLRELRALTIIKHPNVIKLFGAGQHKTFLYLVLELASGQNLLDFMSRNRKNWDQKPICKNFARALSELLLGLQEMSNCGVLHRDIQTKNILIHHSDPNFNYSNIQTFNIRITLFIQLYSFKKGDLKQLDENCTLKICDFGLSAIDEDKSKIQRGSTRHYAPESMESKSQYFSSSDVYMIGNSIWEMVYIKIIFTYLNVGDVHNKVISGQREQFDHKCPQELQKIIEKCWKHAYKERPSFLEVSQDLKAYSLALSNPIIPAENQQVKEEAVEN